MDRMTTLEVARSSLPCRWIREGHYDELEKTLFAQEQDRIRERVRLQELETVNRQIIQELTQLRTPNPDMTLKPGKCDCAIKAAVLRCDHCGRAIGSVP